MKQHTKWLTTLTSIVAGVTMLGSARADTTVTTFDNFTPNALYASWLTATINATPTNYIINNALGYGSLWKQVGLLNAAGNSNLIFDVTLTAANPGLAASNFTVLVDLKDGQSPVNMQYSYRFHGLSAGHHILVGNLFTTNKPATDNGTNIAFYEIKTNGVPGGVLDLSQLWHLNLELDPYTYTNSGNTYTMSLNDLTLSTGTNTSGGGGIVGSTNICATIDSFDGTLLGGLNGSWSAQVSTPTNLQITASGWGEGWAAVAPIVSTDTNKTLQVIVTLTAPSAANGTLGPIVLLQDGTGNQMRYTWYGQNPTTNLVLTSSLGAGTHVVGTTFDFTTISFFHVQIDPSTYAGTYTVAWNDLSVAGCTNSGGGVSTGTNVCATIDSFDYSWLAGLYGSWNVNSETLTTTNFQMTATGWGGGYQQVNYQQAPPAPISTTSNMVLRVDVTIDAAGAGSVLGPIVVLEDGDGTQLQYPWYGQTPGNHVLTMPLMNGSTVQAGSTPGFDFTTITWYHLQLDPSSYSGAYTVSWNNLDIIGCTTSVPTIVITSPTYNRGTGQFSLTWSSETGANYALQTSASAAGSFSDFLTGIPSGGATTSVSVTLTGSKNFVRIRKQ